MANHSTVKVVVVMVPFPAQGHLNQLLHLSRLISSYSIPVHYVGTTSLHRQATLRLHGWHPLSAAAIHFHQIPTPSYPSPPPNPTAPNKFPSHLQPSFDATSHLRRPVAALLRELSSACDRVVVIHDSLMFAVIQDVVSIPNAESYNFQSVSPFAILTWLWEKLGKPYPVDPEIRIHIPPYVSCSTKEFRDFLKSRPDVKTINSGNLYNTCKVIEGQRFDLLAQEESCGSRIQWAIGPFNPVDISQIKDYPSQHRCLEWLDKQDPNSVIFVSFGTTVSLSDEQIEEIAIGLERSDQKFIWVLRDADRADAFKDEEGGGGGNNDNHKRVIELPEGYEERVREKGMVVRDWAPQLQILGHRSTGGFMSHCGWNSCMESISMGTPIAAWPMHSDQPSNSVLVTKLLRVGVEVRDWARKDELTTSSMVEEALRKLMDSREGDEIRKRAADLGVAVRRSVEEGGDSRMDLDSFIAHICR